MPIRVSSFFRVPSRPRATFPHTNCRVIPRCRSIAPPRYFSRVPSSTPAEEVVQKLKDDGCVVIERMLTPSQISRLNADFDASIATVPAGRGANVNTPPLPYGLDAKVFGKNTKRMGNLPGSSPAFREEVADNDDMHNISADIFRETGDYWLSTAQMIEIGPGSKAQPLHADASGWWPFWTMGDHWTPEFSVNFLIAATGTTMENGATGIVRGSHKMKYDDVNEDTILELWNFPDEDVEQVELQPGDCLLLGGKMVHRGEENKTADEFRRVLSCTVISSTLTPEEAHPLLMQHDTARKLSERAKKFLGFRELDNKLGPGVWQNYEKGGMTKALGF